MQLGLTKNHRKTEACIFEAMEGRVLMSAVPANLYEVTPRAQTGNVYAMSPNMIKDLYGFKHYLDNVPTDIVDADMKKPGFGQTIAIVTAYHAPQIQNDLDVFSQRYKLPTTQVEVIDDLLTDVPPDYDGTWATETTMDVEWAHAIAPYANIVIVEAHSDSERDMWNAVQTAIARLQNPPQGQRAGGVLSMSWGRAPEDDSQLELDWNFSGYRNISFVAAAPDTAGQIGYPDASPYVLAVGGSCLKLDSALRRKTESVWYDSGGGFSDVYARPSYQNGVTIDGHYLKNRRATPDVAYNADPDTGYWVYQSYPQEMGGGGGWDVLGGNSIAAPQWAGLVAIANQMRVATGRTMLGSNLVSEIYTLGKTDQSAFFYDIKSGSNKRHADVGFDTASGWGAPRAHKIIQGLTGFTRYLLDVRAYYRRTMRTAAPSQSLYSFRGDGQWTNCGNSGLLDLPLDHAWIGSATIQTTGDTFTITGNRFSFYDTGSVTLPNASGNGNVVRTFRLHYKGIIYADGSVSGSFETVDANGKPVSLAKGNVLYGKFTTRRPIV